ncbi:MAG: NAD+ synthase [Actinobacteria bacterium]|nr:NAD+ synthase [Actinomycetota bacterium]
MSRQTKLRIAAAQLNLLVGDITGNSAKVLESAIRAKKVGAQVVVFPEMVITGYPIEDLALRPAISKAAKEEVEKLASNLDKNNCGDLLAVVGYLDRETKPLNAVALLYGGKIVARYVKRHLPNYGVFDEFRNFAPGSGTLIVRYMGVDIAVAICEDIWRDEGPMAELAARTPGILLVPNGSPFERSKDDLRLELLRKRCQQIKAPIAYVNMVGGQDDLVFDGDSIVIDKVGVVVSRAKQFQEELMISELTVDITSAKPDLVISDDVKSLSGEVRNEITNRLSDEEEIWQALVLGLKDYIFKNQLKSVVLGLSGGIDSSLVATIAVDALGRENVFGVLMPSKYSSEHSLSDAEELADNLGISIRKISIEPAIESFKKMTELKSLAEENIQARVRGSLLMGISNQEGHLVLATGNKSELAVGYSTLYGDAVGGFAPIKDLFKVDVWKLAKWRNQVAQVEGEKSPIPKNSISKEPSAELRPGQRDRDSLPEYETLDQILEIYVDEGGDAESIIKRGFPRELVESVISLVDKAEYKRRQYPPGTKVSRIAFGKDRRLPMTSGWRKRS